MPRLNRVLDGWNRSIGAVSKSQRFPFLFQYFEMWHELIPVKESDYIQQLVWTACLVLYWSMARGGELIANSELRPNRVRTPLISWLEIHPTHAIITLPTSKSDRFSAGANLLLPRLPGSPFCPVRALSHLHALKDELCRHRRFADSNYLFPLPNGRPLAHQRLRLEFTLILRLLNLNCNEFNLHSFRIGAATDLFARGISSDIIKILGRWKGDSHQVYTRPNREVCADFAKAIINKPVIPTLDNITFFFGRDFDLI